MSTRRGSAFAAAACLLLGVAGSCGDDPMPRIASLTAPSTSANDPGPRAPGEVLRVGVASILSSRATIGHYRRLVDHLGEVMGVRTELVLVHSNSEMNELLRRRYVDLAFVCNYAFVRARREFGADALAVPVVRGSPAYRAYIVVRADGPIRTLRDLVGRRFAYADPLCNAGWLYPSFRFRSLGRGRAALPGDESFTYDYEASIRAVASGRVDAAGVESPLYDAAVERGDPLGRATRIVDASPAMGNPPIIVRSDMPVGLRSRLETALLGLHENGPGREILKGMEVDRFVAADPALYAPVFRMAEVVERP